MADVALPSSFRAESTSGGMWLPDNKPGRASGWISKGIASTVSSTTVAVRGTLGIGQGGVLQSQGFSPVATNGAWMGTRGAQQRLFRGRVVC